MTAQSDLSGPEDQVLFFEYVKRATEAEAKCKAANDAKKLVHKEAQLSGYTVEEVKEAMRVNSASDKQKAVDRFSRLTRVMVWLGIMPGGQADLFKDRAPAMERIQNDGLRIGLVAGDRDSGYSRGSNEDTAWLTGFDEGQKLRAEHLEAAMTKTNKKNEKQAADLLKTKKPPKGPDASEPSVADDQKPALAVVGATDQKKTPPTPAPKPVTKAAAKKPSAPTKRAPPRAAPKPAPSLQ